MNIAAFLQKVITTPSGYFCLCLKSGDVFIEEWYNWPSDVDAIIDRAKKACTEYDVYFSTYLFKEKYSIKANVLPTRTIQADLDNADINTIPIQPNIIVETSPGRHQAYWILSTEHSLSIHEILSRKITYSIPNCDHSGWALGRKVRLPETLNHKYVDGPKEVRIISYDNADELVHSDEIEFLNTESVSAHITDEDLSWIETAEPIEGIGPLELLDSIKDKLPPKVYTGYFSVSNDRSEALWALMCACYRAGLSRDEVFIVAYNSPNNKFKDLKYHGNRELAKDVIRAELVVRHKIFNVRSAIDEARKMRGVSTSEKRAMIATIVKDAMRQKGSFIRTTDERSWYIRQDIGRPIEISPRSSYLDSLLYLEYGLNKTEIEQTYTVHALCAYTGSFQASTELSSLSYYNHRPEQVLLHTGRKDVILITADGISRVNNGTYGVLFQWNPINAPFYPNLDSTIDWGDVLFGGALDNLFNLTPQEAMAILKTWFIFLLMRQAAVSKPIIAFFGQPGSGKSTLFRRIYAVLYGPSHGLCGVTSSEDYDHATSLDPFLVLDNVDTPEKWLPDRLATSASGTDIQKRRLYTDNESVRVKRDALIGISAHNPRFNREDVSDRLLLFTFRRLTSFRPEVDIINSIIELRDDIWGSVIKDVQKVLQTPMPQSGFPQFRIEDFAKIGWRIATALCEQDYFKSGLEKIKGEQKELNIQDDSILIDALAKYIASKNGSTGWVTTTDMWDCLIAYCSDEDIFRRVYKTPVFLSRKLNVLQDTLQTLWDVDVNTNERGLKLWRIREHGKA